jgi:Transposase domain (DUF772)
MESPLGGPGAGEFQAAFRLLEALRYHGRHSTLAGPPLFPFLREEEHLDLTPTLEQVIRVLECVEIERFILSSRGYVGWPPKDRIALARAFVAKAVLNLPTTEDLIDRLRVDRSLRRICGFEEAERYKARTQAEWVNSHYEGPSRKPLHMGKGS